MNSINGSMRYIYDQSTLFDVKISLEAVLRQCQDIDNTFANYSMKLSEVTSNFHEDVIDASLVVGVISDDASSAAASASPVSIVAYNLEPITASIDLVQHHASFVSHDEKQAIVPVSENCVDDNLCTDIMCINQGQFDVGLKAGHATILDKGGTVLDTKCDDIMRGVTRARCDGQNAVLNLMLGAVGASGLDPSLRDGDAEEVTESARVCPNRIFHCEYNAVDFDCSSGPAPTAVMVSYYASVCNLHNSVVASTDVSIGKATYVSEVFAHNPIPVNLSSAVSTCTFNTTAIVISSHEGQEAKNFLHDNMKDLTDIVSRVV